MNTPDMYENLSVKSGFCSLELYGAAIEKQREEDGCFGYHLENESGTGEVLLYRVFPGIELVYNDMRLGYCTPEQKAAADVLEINYCQQGRCECSFGAQSCCYVSAGDLSLCFLQRRAHQSVFPTAHYQGITVTIEFSGITQEIRNILELFSVKLFQIKEFSGKQDFYIIRADDRIKQLFAQLYAARGDTRQSYIRVKVLELLLLLTDLDFGGEREERPYFSKAQVDCVKQIRRFMIAHLNEHYTIEELSKRFMISPTALKRCFRGIYGDSVYAYLRAYRLQTAERLLREEHLSVAEIAGRIGYGNPNKFTSAFRREYGVTPTAYKKSVQTKA